MLTYSIQTSKTKDVEFFLKKNVQSQTIFYRVQSRAKSFHLHGQKVFHSCENIFLPEKGWGSIFLHSGSDSELWCLGS